MKISELQEKLESYREKHGDLEVKVYHEGNFYEASVESVTLLEDGGRETFLEVY